MCFFYSCFCRYWSEKHKFLGKISQPFEPGEEAFGLLLLYLGTRQIKHTDQQTSRGQSLELSQHIHVRDRELKNPFQLDKVAARRVHHFCVSQQPL